jgi:hypothetical protein
MVALHLLVNLGLIGFNCARLMGLKIKLQYMIFILWWKKKYQKKVKAAKSEQPGVQLNTLTIKKKNR